jgi:hypothetical protein
MWQIDPSSLGRLLKAPGSPPCGISLSLAPMAAGSFDTADDCELSAWRQPSILHRGLRRQRGPVRPLGRTIARSAFSMTSTLVEMSATASSKPGAVHYRRQIEVLGYARRILGRFLGPPLWRLLHDHPRCRPRRGAWLTGYRGARGHRECDRGCWLERAWRCGLHGRAEYCLGARHFNR